MADNKNTPTTPSPAAEPARESNPELAAAQAENVALKAQLAEQHTLIKELQEKLEKAGTPIVSQHPVVTVGKDKYQVTLPQFRFKGVEYKAAELAEHKEVIKALLEAKVEFLKKL